MMDESGVQHPDLQEKNVPKTRHTDGIERNVESSARKDANNMFDLLPSRKNIDEPPKGGQRNVQIDDSQDSEDSLYEAPKARGEGKARAPRSAKNAQGDETSQNLTYLSFLEVKSPLMLSLPPLTSWATE